MVGKSRARGRQSRDDANDQLKAEEQPHGAAPASAERRAAAAAEPGEAEQGLASPRLAASLAWAGRDWFVTRGPFDWAKSPSDLSPSLLPYLCCPFFLRGILRLAQQLGKGLKLGLTQSTRVEGHCRWNSVTTAKGDPARRTCHFLSCL